ncbi:SRPBCC family protein [Nocardioides zeae]|uniref:SRPBCC family protein n=1 Tax=Nocardioides zeae TaxID=1457234 RepID=A0A6P0HJ99_9ACTN|nr:SRPBCC family protein [Nocardioides zeae]NEN78683.1 SRPBCC family protein [Nocardioides zeae]
MTSSRTFSDSIVVAASPEAVWDVVSDVTRTGEWSPICRACWWDEGDGPRVGAHFTGRNETPDRTWETRSEVVVADPGRAFGWAVNDRRVFWSYTIEPVDGGSRLTESWEFTPRGQEFVTAKFGPEGVELREQMAREGIPVTLAAIKAVVERG